MAGTATRTLRETGLVAGIAPLEHGFGLIIAVWPGQEVGVGLQDAAVGHGQLLGEHIFFYQAAAQELADRCCPRTVDVPLLTLRHQACNGRQAQPLHRCPLAKTCPESLTG